jgi:hypothetical protein
MSRLVEKQVGPDLMIYDGEVDSVHLLNQAAQVIYELHRKGLGEEAIAQAIQDRFAVPAGQDLAGDIRLALQALAAQGLIPPAPEA